MVIHRALWPDLRLGRIALDPGLQLHRQEFERVLRRDRK
jgi:hypothetical protein